MTEIIIDNPQPGWFVMRRHGRDIPAKIFWDVEGDLFGVIDGKQCPAEDVWNYHRARITPEEYDRLMARAAPLVPTVETLPALITAAQKWRDATITNAVSAEKCRDLREVLKKVKDPLIASYAKKINPLREQINPIQRQISQLDSDCDRLIAEIETARELLRAKLTDWLVAEKRRVETEQAARAPATVDGAVGDTLSPVVIPGRPQIRGNQPGRAASLRTYRRVEVSDFDLAVQTFRNHPDLVATLNKLGSEATRKSKGAAVAGFSIITEERASS
jgi:hypothetical protein